MGLFPESRLPQTAIALVSTFDVWCAGMELIIQRWGWTFAGCWRGCSEAFTHGRTQPERLAFNVAIIASHLLDRPLGAGLFRPFKSDYSGHLIVAIEPGNAFSMQDFMSLDVEGVILSTASFEQVIDCIETVGGGGRWVDPGIRAQLAAQQAEVQGLDHACLSNRELQIARLAASGLSNKHIARELGISDGTVKMHMHHVLGKLNVGSRFNLGQLECLQVEVHNPGQFKARLLEKQNASAPLLQY